MTVLWTVVVLAFVIAVVATVAFALFEASPFARHSDRYRDPVTGVRTAQAPNLEDGRY